MPAEIKIKEGVKARAGMVTHRKVPCPCGRNLVAPAALSGTIRCGFCHEIVTVRAVQR